MLFLFYIYLFDCY